MQRALFVACLAGLLAACSSPGAPAKEQLGGLGEALVPSGAYLVEISEGSCPQLAGNPSCARVHFTSDLPEEARVEAFIEAARHAGWEVVSREPRRDGTLVELGRDGYRAFAAIWEDAHAAPCREQPDESCADEVQVIEDV